MTKKKSDYQPYHVYPVNDLKEHEISDRCWCDPELIEGVWVHNSADGREHYENGDRKPH